MSKKAVQKQIIIFLKSEYDLARHEWEYYTTLFNNQDKLYSIYFAIFAIIIAAIYYIIKVNNHNTIFDNIVLYNNQRIIICSLIIFMAVTYMYLFIIMMGNSYYLIIYSEKIIILERLLNHYIRKNVFIWETHFMSIIQSTNNVFTEGYLNVNMIKVAFAIILYSVVEVPLCILWYIIVQNNIAFCLYLFIFIIISLLILYNWVRMWKKLPLYYRKQLKKIYKRKLKEKF